MLNKKYINKLKKEMFRFPNKNVKYDYDFKKSLFEIK
jgi:hypothetical protein